MTQDNTLREAMQATNAAIQKEITRWLDAQHTPNITRFIEAQKHGAIGAGKGFRPFLLLETLNLFNPNAAQQQAGLIAATALECVHAYSLIHDDLPAMDNDDLRRGQPTVHKAYDEATAILAGDALLTLALEKITDVASHVNAQTALDVTKALAKAAGTQGMVGGQYMDLAAEGRFDERPAQELDHIKAIQFHKTGALICFATYAGAKIGGATAEEINALERYAINLGQAFQMADDILDVTSNSHALGKTTGKDKHAGKATYVDILGLEGAEQMLKQTRADAEKSLTPVEKNCETLISIAHFAAMRKH